MKRITHNSEWYILTLKKYQQFPKKRMKDRVAAGNIEIRQSVIDLAEVLAVGDNILHLLPCHALKLAASLSGKNIAMLTALVTFIRDMPLKCKIPAHPILSFF
jgi:hypothetical protein